MIEIQYFPECPNYLKTIKSINELISEGLILEAELKLTPVLDFETAQKLKFLGSPTILYNGIDIYTECKPVGFNYACRLYIIDGLITGSLTKDFIKEKINKLKQLKEEA